MNPFDPFQFNLLLVNYAALFVSLPVIVTRNRWALLDGISTADRVGLVGATLVGLFTRLSEGAIFRHENAHAYRLLDMIIEPSADLHVYGSGYIALFHPLFRLLPPMSEFLIFGVLLLGTLTILPAGLLVTRLFGRWVGAVSALFLATTNIHVIHSASESRFVVVMAFLMLALWLATEARRTGRMDVAFVCALAAAPAAQMRPELIFVPLLPLLFAFLPGYGQPLLRRRAGWLLLVTLPLLLAGHAVWMWQLHAAMPGDRLRELMKIGDHQGLLHALRDGPILLSTELLPRLRLVMVALTLFVAIRLRFRGVLLLTTVTVGFFVLYAQASTGFIERERFIVPAHTFFALLIGPGALTLARWIEARLPIRRIAFPLVLLLVFSGPEAAGKAESSPNFWEYAVLRGGAGEVPDGCLLVTQGDYDDSPAMPGYSRHELLYRTRASALITTDDPSLPAAIDEELKSENGCVAYLRTTSCFACNAERSPTCVGPVSDEGKAIPPRRCGQFENLVGLEPLALWTLDPTEFDGSLFAYPAEPFDIGYYRVVRSLAPPPGTPSAPEEISDPISESGEALNGGDRL